jgi:hypothetical protein
MKFRSRGGVCNIPLLRAHVIDLFFEDTCVQVIWFQYMDVCLLMDSCDAVDDYDVMLLDIFVLIDVIEEFPLSV